MPIGSFENPITGAAGALLINQVRSPNFVHGVSGWQIAKDGSAEFNNLVVRGVFDGTDFEINSNGIFFYSSAPALGNLIAWAANSNGTDAHGNAYYTGIGSTLPGSQVSLLQDGVLAIGSVTQTIANTQALFDWLSDGESAITSGRVNVSDPAQSVIDMQSQAKSGITGGQVYIEAGKLIFGNTAVAWYDDSTGEGFFNAVACTVGGVPEVWHNVSPPAGWSGVNRYRYVTEEGLMIVDIQLTNAGTSGNITCMTLPGGYTPATNHSMPLAITTTAALPNTLRITFNTSGVVQTSALPASTTGIFGTWHLPLD